MEQLSRTLYPLLCLGSELSSICLRTEFGGSGTGLREEARENWLNEGTEDDLGTAGLRERHPKDENELEGVVEGLRWSAQVGRAITVAQLTEPVHSIDHAFNDGQECVDDPILKKGLLAKVDSSQFVLRASNRLQSATINFG